MLTIHLKLPLPFDCKNLEGYRMSSSKYQAKNGPQKHKIYALTIRHVKVCQYLFQTKEIVNFFEYLFHTGHCSRHFTNVILQHLLRVAGAIFLLIFQMRKQSFRVVKIRPRATLLVRS